MVNEEKLRTMIALARYEQEPLRTELRESGYYRVDYIRAHLLETLWSFSAAYVLILLLAAAYHFEYLFSKFQLQELRSLVIAVAAVYLLLLLGCALVTILVYSAKYHRIQKIRRMYLAQLEQLKAYYTQSREGNGE